MTLSRPAGPTGRTAVAALAAGVLALATAACGSAAPARAQSSGSAAGTAAFTTCMRAHGIPDFPDLKRGAGTVGATGDQNGRITIAGVTLKESPAQFRSATQACAASLTAGTAGAGPSPQMQKAALAYAQCMRAHGVTNFPDPGFKGGAPAFPITKAMGINSQSAVFQQAQTACLPLMAAAGSAARASG